MQNKPSWARTILRAVFIAVLAWASAFMPAAAQDNYPSAPIRIVLGFPPGATTDVVARLLAQKLSSQMNVNVVVDNKAGANGNIGADFVAKSKPDGYTLLLNTPSVILSPALGEKLTYELFKELAPVAMVASSPQLLVVHPSVPANSAPEFVSYLRANPDKLSYCSAGVGNSNHLGPLLFLQVNGLSALHVPYKGSGPAIIDLVAGRVQFAMQTLPAVLPMVKEGRLRALAISSLRRSAALPEMPTLAETVTPGFEVGTWFGVMVPAKTPPAIVKRLNAEILKALQDPESRTRLTQESADPRGSTPEEYGAYLKSELERWTKVIKSAGIKPE